MSETRFLTNRMIYEETILCLVPSARRRLWIIANVFFQR